MEYRRGRISLDADIYNRPTVGLFVAGCSPAPNQVGRRATPVRKSKLKTGFDEARRHDSPALEDELGFGAQDEGADLEHPVGRRQPDWRPVGSAQGGHEIAIGQRSGRGDVDGAGQVGAGDEEFDRLDEVCVVDPRHELATGTGRAAQTHPNQVEKDLESSAPVGAHDDRAAQSDLARVRRYGFEEGLLPGGRDVVAETPRRRQSRLTASDLTVDLTHRPIQRVAVDGRGAGVHPEPRRLGRLRDRVADQPRGDDSGLYDLAAVGLAVSAVDAATRQVDDDVGAVQLTGPITEAHPIPGDRRPRSRMHVTRDDRHVNTSTMEMARQDLPDLPAPAGDDDPQLFGSDDFVPRLNVRAVRVVVDVLERPDQLA